MKQLVFRKAKNIDRDIIVDLLYCTEKYPEYEWGKGTKEEHKIRLKSLITEKENRFSLENIIVGELDNNVVGIILILEGKKIKRQTILSDFSVIKGIEKKFFCKMQFIMQMLSYFCFEKECEKNELYISNIIIEEMYRGLDYSNQFFGKVYDIAKEKGYNRISLTANNDNLVRYYEKKGYILKNKKSRKMYIDI